MQRKGYETMDFVFAYLFPVLGAALTVAIGPWVLPLLGTGLFYCVARFLQVKRWIVKR